MIGAIKIAGMSAVLAAGFVVGSSGGQSPLPSAKKYSDRVPQAVTLVTDAAHPVRPQTAPCAAQTWPYLASECLSGTDAARRRAVRTITVEQREGTNTSVLVRLPVATVASR